MKSSISRISGCLLILIVAMSITGMPLSAQTNSSVSNVQYLYPVFANGLVKMKNGTFYQAFLNYNTISQCMVWEKDGKRIDLSNMQSVDTVVLQNTKFVPFEDSFYELLVNGPISLFIQHKSDLVEAGSPAGYGTTSKTASAKNYSSVSMKGMIYNLELPSNYTVNPSDVYWIRKNGSMLSFLNKRQMLKLFPEKSNEIDKFIKQDHLNLTKHNDLVKLGSYLNKIAW
jgi:hypothetical protein